MFGNLMDKLQATQGDLKQKLDSIIVDGQAENGLVKVAANANGEVLQINIEKSLVEEGDKDALEELTLVAVNRALQKANEVKEKEMRKIAGDLLGGGF